MFNFKRICLILNKIVEKIKQIDDEIKHRLNSPISRKVIKINKSANILNNDLALVALNVYFIKNLHYLLALTLFNNLFNPSRFFGDGPLVRPHGDKSCCSSCVG